MAVFYMFYWLLLRKETFHRLNRIVLVGAVVLAFMLPLCIITIHKPMEMDSQAPALSELPADGIVTVAEKSARVPGHRPAGKDCLCPHGQR